MCEYAFLDYKIECNVFVNGHLSDIKTPVIKCKRSFETIINFSSCEKWKQYDNCKDLIKTCKFKITPIN